MEGNGRARNLWDWDLALHDIGDLGEYIYCKHSLTILILALTEYLMVSHSGRMYLHVQGPDRCHPVPRQHISTIDALQPTSCYTTI